MQMHEFGSTDAPAVMFIHGALCPWQTLQHYADVLSDRYHVLVPALNAHVAGQHTDYVSIEGEARELVDWLLAQRISYLHAVCGISMGGAIANVLWNDRRVIIDRLVLDGAPLVRCPKMLSAGMLFSYTAILKGTRIRNPRTKAGFEKNFLPLAYWEDFCALADVMDEKSLRNLIYSVGTSHLHDNMPAGTRVLYLHGTAFPGEFLSCRTARKLRKARPDAKIVKLPGMKHCEAAIYHRDKWLEIVQPFIDEA